MRLKKEEAWIRDIVLAAEEPAAMRAWLRMLDYFSTKDYLEGYQHMRTIREIYLTAKYKWKTCAGMAAEANTVERTFYRYRELYINCFLWYYTDEKKKQNAR